MDVATARQRGLHEADDGDLLAAALAEERVMLTNGKVNRDWDISAGKSGKPGML
jgi:hypothetical protein